MLFREMNIIVVLSLSEYLIEKYFSAISPNPYWNGQYSFGSHNFDSNGLCKMQRSLSVGSTESVLSIHMHFNNQSFNHYSYVFDWNFGLYRISLEHPHLLFRTTHNSASKPLLHFHLERKLTFFWNNFWPWFCDMTLDSRTRPYLSAISKHQSRWFDWYFKDVITVSLNISAQFCILCFNSIVVWNHIPFSVDGQAIAAHVQANVCALFGRQGETGGGWKVRRKAKFRHKLFLPRRITISAKIIWWWWEKNYGYLCSAQTPP